MNSDPYILILYYSRNGSTQKMAQQIATGVEQIDAMQALIRTVPPVSTTTEATDPVIPEEGDIFCSIEELKNASGLAIGSPTRFGNMAAPLKYFIDQSSELWMNGNLIDKPATAFTSTGSLHGGQESTLLTMMLPLLHLGMVYTGIPYNNKALHMTSSGGTPYGASHWQQHHHNNTDLTQDEISLCQSIGKRLATLALRLT
jgi:NAD(P)H dehydrogenase (quinone)